MVAVGLDLLIIHDSFVFSHQSSVLLSFLLEPDLRCQLVTVFLFLFLFSGDLLLILECVLDTPLPEKVSIGFLLDPAKVGLILMLSHLLFESQTLRFLLFRQLDLVNRLSLLRHECVLIVHLSVIVGHLFALGHIVRGHMFLKLLPALLLPSDSFVLRLSRPVLLVHLRLHLQSISSILFRQFLLVLTFLFRLRFEALSVLGNPLSVLPL